MVLQLMDLFGFEEVTCIFTQIYVHLACIPLGCFEHGKVARVICSVYKTDGTPFEGDPRNNLKRVLEDMRKMGFKDSNIDLNQNFFLFKTDEKRVTQTTNLNDKEKLL